MDRHAIRNTTRHVSKTNNLPLVNHSANSPCRAHGEEPDVKAAKDFTLNFRRWYGGRNKISVMVSESLVNSLRSLSARTLNGSLPNPPRGACQIRGVNERKRNNIMKLRTVVKHACICRDMWATVRMISAMIEQI